jgi:uncharacterized protein GlcG (DUF336 family)
VRFVAAVFALSAAILAQDAVTPPPTLTAADVQSVVQNAASSVNSTTMVIAVTDRMGNILAVFSEPNAPATTAANFSTMVSTPEVAIALARTASFFSNSDAPLSSRTVRFISTTHFPAGVMYTSNAPLYGIENTNRGCSLNVAYPAGQVPVPPATLSDGVTPGLGPLTGKVDLNDSDQSAVNPGGVPLYKGGILVGGVGVTGVPGNVAEFAALSGSVGAGFGPAPAAPGVVFINGIALPFVNQTTQPDGTSPAPIDVTNPSNGSFILPLANPSANACPNGAPACPIDSPGPAPEGDLIPVQAGSLLSQSDVQGIVDAAVAAAQQTRAVIRLPIGTRAEMAIAVSDLDGTLLALHRMPDATVFSIDVAAAKSRNVIYFTGALPPLHAGTAVTNRTIGFGAQPFYPPGIDHTSPGPFFDLYTNDVANPCTQGAQPPNPNQSGIVFFPGSLPLYRNGVLVGGLGVSGDGVDQDDYVTALGAINFPAPASIRADQVILRGVRLPYQTFPRNPTN